MAPERQAELRGYIGIDFGTTNSHIAYTDLSEGALRATPVALDAAERKRSATTCVLWKQPGRTEQDFFLYGDAAIEEWLMMDVEERSAHRFAAGFKPDLATSETARLDAWAFLRQAYLEMRGHRTPPQIGEDEGMPVVIGVPAKSSDQHRAYTVAAAEQAGLGRVECLAEPLGALAYHLAHGQLTEDEVERGVLVVDFGGGTLDIAWLDQDGIRAPWGDPLLGGRLFDDLFFQWLTETSGTDLDAFQEPELLYAWMVGCRQLKERFSRHWAQRQGAGERGFDDFKGRAEVAQGRTLGILRDASLEELEARARRYRPSQVARSYFERIGTDLSGLGNGDGIDLLDRIRDTIDGGPDLILDRDYAVVVLTGGSSSWPFMSDIVSQRFDIPPERILRATNPEQTIGEGIAIYNVLRQHHRRSRRRIRDDLPELKREIHTQVDQEAREAAGRLATRILREIIGIARTHYFEWYEHGGVLAEVDARVREEIARIPLTEIARERLGNLSRELQTQVHDMVRVWLKRHHVSAGSDAEEPVEAPVPKEILTLSLRLDVGEVVGAQISRVLSIVLATMVASLSGGSGIALIASGPLGLVLGAALGGAAALAGQGRMRKALHDHDFKGASHAAFKRLYSRERLERAIHEAEQDLRAALEEPVRTEIDRFIPTLEAHAQTAANAALKRFEILEQLS